MIASSTILREDMNSSNVASEKLVGYLLKVRKEVASGGNIEGEKKNTNKIL